MAGTLWIMNCKNAIKWEHTINCNLSTKVNIICFLNDNFYLTSRVHNAILICELTIFIFGWRKDGKPQTLVVEYKKLSKTNANHNFTGPCICSIENTCINRKEGKQVTKVLDNIWEKFGSPHLYWHGIYSLWYWLWYDVYCSLKP